MPYKDADKQKEANRDRMRKVRGNTKGNTLLGNTGQGNTEYPAILHALTDPIKRRKLEKICESLKNHNVEKCVTYGVYGPDFEMVGELLEVTR